MPDPDTSSSMRRNHPRACRNCATAKAKCVFEQRKNNGAACERCLRMELECTAQAPEMRKRREVKAARVGNLEEKLDSIVNLLSQSHSQNIPQNSAQQHISPNPPLLWSLAPAPSPAFQNEPSASQAILPTPPKDQEDEQDSPAFHLSDSVPLPSLNLGGDEEEARLNVFRKEMTEHFPFVVISRDIMAHSLKKERPFLFASIMVAASRFSLSHQKSLERTLLEYLSVHLILNGERSLDLLQGLLVYIAWCNHQRGARYNPQMSNLIQLAIAMVVELGLNKIPRPAGRQAYLIEATKTPFCEDPAKLGHSLDAMRAFVGCFYLSSVISSYFKKLDAMLYTSYMEKCCVALVEIEGSSTDQYLVQLVRLQHFVRKIQQSLPTEELEVSWTSNIPAVMYVKTLSKELQTFKDSLPLDLQSAAPFLVQYHSVEIMLYEISLSEPLDPNDNHKLLRIELLYTCLLAVKSFFEAYFLIPARLYYNLTFVTWTQLASILAVLGRLLIFVHEGWDLTHARQVIDFPTILDRLAKMFEEAGKEGEGLEGDNVFLQYARMMQWAKSSVTSKIGPDTFAESLPADMSRLVDEQETGEYLYLDAFWQEFMGDLGGNTSGVFP